jgi:oligoribonuclease (3'-5' exoribonuclease)
VQACRESKISLEEAEERMLQFVATHTQPGVAILAGNTVHADKRFLDVYMPKFMGHLHYRIMVRFPCPVVVVVAPQTLQVMKTTVGSHFSAHA